MNYVKRKRSKGRRSKEGGRQEEGKEKEMKEEEMCYIQAPTPHKECKYNVLQTCCDKKKNLKQEK